MKSRFRIDKTHYEIAAKSPIRKALSFLTTTSLDMEILKLIDRPGLDCQMIGH
jgi:hypothetical protein